MSAALPRRPRQSAYAPLHPVSATLTCCYGNSHLTVLRYIQEQELFFYPTPGKEK